MKFVIVYQPEDGPVSLDYTRVLGPYDTMEQADAAVEQMAPVLGSSQAQIMPCWDTNVSANMSAVLTGSSVPVTGPPGFNFGPGVRTVDPTRIDMHSTNPLQPRNDGDSKSR